MPHRRLLLAIVRLTKNEQALVQCAENIVSMMENETLQVLSAAERLLKVERERTEAGRAGMLNAVLCLPIDIGPVAFAQAAA